MWSAADRAGSWHGTLSVPFPSTSSWTEPRGSRAHADPVAYPDTWNTGHRETWCHVFEIDADAMVGPSSAAHRRQHGNTETGKPVQWQGLLASNVGSAVDPKAWKQGSGETGIQGTGDTWGQGNRFTWEVEGRGAQVESA